jgi:hypothetical protein
MFRQPFVSPVSKLFPQDAAAIPWYLSGGIAAASCKAAYQAKGAASLAASYINLKSPGTYNCTPGVAPTWNTADGWVADGTKYLDTGISSPHNGWSMLVRFSNSVTAGSNQAVCGDINSSGKYFILEPRTSGIFYFYGDNYKSSTPITYGVIGICGNVGYKNGNIDVTSIGTYLGTGTNVNIYILAYNSSPGVASSHFIGNVQAVSIYSVTLTAPQVSAVTNAMNLL